MKNILLILLLLPFVAFNSGCKKKVKSIPIELSFSTPFPTPEIDVVDSLLVLETFSFPTAIEDAMRSQNTTKDKLEEAVLENMEMTIVHPQNVNFNFLKQIEVYMKADGLPEKLSASLLDIPMTELRTIFLNSSGESMHEYLKKDEVQLVIKMVLRAPMKSGTLINIKTKYKGKAGVL